MTERMTPERFHYLSEVYDWGIHLEHATELASEVERQDDLLWDIQDDLKATQVRLAAAEAICERVAKMDSFRDDELVIKWKETKGDL